MSVTIHPPAIFLGFCAKQGSGVASVSGCISRRPANWIDRWNFNRAFCWDSEAAALASVPIEAKWEFRLFAYRLIPVLFSTSNQPRAVSIDDLFANSLPPLPDSPGPSGYRSLGYDIVELPPPPATGFGCSPLSCNGMAKEIPVNKFCLVDNLGTAFVIARQFAKGRPEPGPYVVIEVLSIPNP